MRLYDALDPLMWRNYGHLIYCLQQPTGVALPGTDPVSTRIPPAANLRILEQGCSNERPGQLHPTTLRPRVAVPVVGVLRLKSYQLGSLAPAQGGVPRHTRFVVHVYIILLLLSVPLTIELMLCGGVLTAS